MRNRRLANPATAGRIVAIVLATLLLAACATPADPGAMTLAKPEGGVVAGALKGAVCVRKVMGGEETNPLWVSQVGNGEFTQSLTNSLANAGMLGSSASCRFFVDADLLGLSQPAFGLALEVTAHVNYKVYDKADRPALMETIKSAYTAQFSDSPIAVHRLRLANEGAIRTSITSFMDKLKTLK